MKEKILQAGKIAKDIREYIRPLIKKDTPLLEIAEKIEDKMIELGGKPAFPTNLSIDNITAHSTPTYNDETLARGLLKIDFGIHIDGWTSDTAFSIDLENSEENKKLIEASEKALENAIKIAKENISANEIGKTISETIESYNFSPVRNLAGHQMENYELHAGITIPNIDDNKNITLPQGLYAIEPFATNGSGKVHDGKPSEIYMVIDSKNVRSPIAREMLNFILEEYQTLPFCSRWLVKKFGTKALIGLSQLTQNGNLHRFAQLIETLNSKVAQSEHTILIEKDKVIVTTK
jgi:methionyl aminopeptidase